MIKKLALVAVALAIATPAFAIEFPFNKGGDLKIINEGTQVTKSTNKANTGYNQVKGVEQTPKFSLFKHEDNKDGSITTGAALISSFTQADMNSTTVGCGCSKDLKDVSVTNKGTQHTFSMNDANTGFNTLSGNGKIITGAAGIESVVFASLNTTVIGGKE